MMLWQKCLLAFQYFKGAYEKEEEWQFMHADSDRTVGNSFKLREVRFRLEVGEKNLTVKMVKHWKKLHRACLLFYENHVQLAYSPLSSEHPEKTSQVIYKQHLNLQNTNSQYPSSMHTLV